MRQIALTQGQVALVDDEDYEILNQYKWHAHWTPSSNTFYAEGRLNGKHISMHRVILGAQSGQQVDHKDHNGLHNERENIRLCTRSQNQSNLRKRSNMSSRYKGVGWHGYGSKWRAQIKINGIERHLSVFVLEEDAARVYDIAAREAFGEFAFTNF